MQKFDVILLKVEVVTTSAL